jgi:hypothetical protein
MDTFTNGFTKQNVQFRPHTPPSSSYGGDSLDFETIFFPKLVTPPLLWYMEEIYGATKGPRQYSWVVGTIELDDSIQKFKNWSDMQQMCSPQLFTPFMAWKGLFQHLEGLFMDDYHEFKRAHEIQIEWRLYWFPNYVSITRGIVAPSGATVIPSISSTSGSGSANGNGITESGGTNGGGGVGASTNTRGPLFVFNPVVELFHELQQNYQGVRIENLQSL